MSIHLKSLKLLVILSLFFSLLPTLPKASAATQTSYSQFESALAKELEAYIQKSGGNVTLQYRDLTNGDEYQINAKSSRSAASTIKLPLALYVMELASAGKINLNQKLTYKSYHYYGGSGVIQKDKVGTRYTIRDLIKKAMIYSDNIAFIMLKEKVGRANFNTFLKKAGGQYAYPNGQNVTSSRDLTIYANRLYNFSQKDPLGKELIGYLKKTIYNETIPSGVKGTEVAHKVGMMPWINISNDVGIVYDKDPYILAVMTTKMTYEKSKKIIAGIASIVNKHHKAKHATAKYFKTKKTTYVYQNTSGKLVKLGTLLKSQTFKITGDKSFYDEIQFGTKKGYVAKKDVTSYKTVSTTGFSNGSIKNNGLVKATKTGYVRTSMSLKASHFATVYKNATVNFHSVSGNYYKVSMGDRIGYIHKGSFALQFTPAVKYFKVNQDNLAVYSNTKGTKIGTLIKGQIFPRVKESGDFHTIQLGGANAYVKKSGTLPIFTAKINDPAGTKTIGQIQLATDAKVYNSLSEKATAIGAISKGQKIAYIEKLETGFKINVSGRTGYVRSEAVIITNDLPTKQIAIGSKSLKVVPAAATQTKSTPIRITFAGDTMMDWSIKTTIKNKGVDYPFAKVKSDVSKSDLAVANLETAITTRTAKYTKEYNFKSNPSSLKGLTNTGFDLVSLANNHSMDYQLAGLTDTMKNLKSAKLPYIGAGYNTKEAYTAKTFTVDGKKIKFLAFSKVLPSTTWIAQSKRAGLANGYNIDLMTSTIKRENKGADYLFVYIHWGVERNRKPEAYQRDWAKKMINAGADGIIGSHPHVLQGFEYYKGKPIAYSLGNFLFPDYVSGVTAQTGLLHLNIEKGKIRMTFTPYYISNDQIKTQSSTSKKKVWSSLQSISYGVKISDGKIIDN